MELIDNIAQARGSVYVFGGVDEHLRERNLKNLRWTNIASLNR